MATITEIIGRTGAVSYRAQVRIKRNGRVVFAKARTFDKKKLAEAWAAKLENEMRDAPDIELAIAIKKLGKLTVADLIAQYIEAIDNTPTQQLGTSKRSVLGILARSDLGAVTLDQLSSLHIIQHCRTRAYGGTKPQTINQDVIYLGVVLGAAKSLLGIPASRAPVDEAIAQLKSLRLISKNDERERRLQPGELEKMLGYCDKRMAGRGEIPIADLIRFAIASCMRLGEIVRIRIEDLDHQKRTVKIRDRKDPKQKAGNDEVVPLLGLAWDLVKDRPQNTDGLIWPYNPDSVSAAFRKVADLAGAHDLRFHDLRHEGISRLFEQGYQIHQVAMVSGHKNWKTLKRYTQLKPEDLHRDEIRPASDLAQRSDRR